MQDLEGSEHEKRIEREIRWCMTWEPGGKCLGAGGRKLRQVCVWCPNYQKERKEDEEDR